MRHLILLPLLLLAAPAHADDLQKQKREIIKNTKQETYPLGDNRFLIFSAIKSPFQYAWGIEMIKIEGGTPKLDPLFMEEYDTENKKIAIGEGVGFPALSYHFDPATGALDYTSRDVEADIRFAYKYKLVGDTFALQQISMQDISQCADTSCKDTPPTILFGAEPKEAKKEEKKEEKAPDAQAH